MTSHILLYNIVDSQLYPFCFDSLCVEVDPIDYQKDLERLQANI